LRVHFKELLEGKTPIGEPERFLCFLILNVYHANQRHVCVVSITLTRKLLTLGASFETLSLVEISGSVLVWDLKGVSTASTSLHGLVLVLPLFVIYLQDHLVYFFIVHVIELFEILVVVHEYAGQRLLLTQYYVIIEFDKLLQHQILSKVDLFLLDIVVDCRALVHQMVTYHQLDIGQHFRYHAFLPVVLVQVDREAP
jgi:hypothetical protein